MLVVVLGWMGVQVGGTTEKKETTLGRITF